MGFNINKCIKNCVLRSPLWQLHVFDISDQLTGLSPWPFLFTHYIVVILNVMIIDHTTNFRKLHCILFVRPIRRYYFSGT